MTLGSTAVGFPSCNHPKYSPSWWTRPQIGILHFYLSKVDVPGIDGLIREECSRFKMIKDITVKPYGEICK